MTRTKTKTLPNRTLDCCLCLAGFVVSALALLNWDNSACVGGDDDSMMRSFLLTATDDNTKICNKWQFWSSRPEPGSVLTELTELCLLPGSTGSDNADWPSKEINSYCFCEIS